MKRDDLSKLSWQKGDGLLPAVVQHARTGAVLMLGYMDLEALQRTLDSGRVVFFSRSKGRLWMKGERSGNTLSLVNVSADCDGDALLVLAEPAGAVCHAGTPTCFPGQSTLPAQQLAFLASLEAIILRRTAERPEGSYAAELLSAGILRVAQKFGEEALELALAGAAQTEDRVVAEAADAIFHLLLVLRSRGVSLCQVIRELESRHLRSAVGFEETSAHSC
jgi:phosphoribosyl-ATP pyrophosphohydrolase/phosphoribosyl-AMP cyclohydrolase